MTENQFCFYQQVWADYAWWCRRGFHDYGFEHKLTAHQPVQALRKLLVPVDGEVALIKLRELCDKLLRCADIDAINRRSFAARVIEHRDLFYATELAAAREWLRLANEDEA